MGNTSIEWTNKTWNPVSGCSKVSPGCKNCYAERLFPRPYPGRKFTEIRTHPDRLEQPLHWRTPQMIFANSMSDIFHTKVPTAFIVRVFDTMNRAAWHTFQMLTKRSERLLELAPDLVWPSNVWMGVSVESEEYTFRIDHLRQTGAFTKFLSLEPLLGPLPNLDLRGIHWVIVGGESGPNARPMEDAWVRSIRDQCHAANLPFFYKQKKEGTRVVSLPLLDGKRYVEFPGQEKAG